MLLNAAQKQGLYKFAVYGRGGVGKTHLGVTMPKPLIILTERQGFETVRVAAARMKIPMPPVFWVRDLAQVRAIAGHLRSRTERTIEGLVNDPEVLPDADLKAYGLTRAELVKQIPYGAPDSIVIDMLGEVAEWVGDEIDRVGGMDMEKNLEVRKLQAWMPIGKRVTGLIRAFRDAPYHVLFLCHDRIFGGKGDENTEGAQVWPKLPGRDLHKTLMQSVNAMGRMRLIEATVEVNGKPTTKVYRVVEFITSDHVMTKHATPLRDREPPNAARWIAALSSETRNDDAPEQLVDEGEAPPESADTKTSEPAEGEKKTSRKRTAKTTETQETK